MMKLYIFMLLILVQDFVESEELLTNRTFPRSRYSFRNRKLALLSTESQETTTSTTTESPETSTSTTSTSEITLEPMEVVVESQSIQVVDPRKKFAREVPEKITASDRNLKCGDRYHGDAPWIAIIEHRDPTGRDRRKTLSKGVLISARHVLTTVSSVHNTHPFWITTRVRLGDYPTWMNHNIVRDRSNIVSVDVDKVYQHSSKDIAILQLKETVPFGDYIQPICLPVSSDYNHPELYLHICKKARGDGYKSHIELFSVKPLSPRDCTTMFHRKGALVTDGEFCAWDKFGDTCTGDIGGPLMAEFYGRYMVVGLNSFVLTDKEFDSTDYPGVYVNVGYYIKWIDDIISIKEQ